MEKYIIAGGSGFIGKHLSALLIKQPAEVYVLTTQKKILSPSKMLHYIYWNPTENYIDPAFTVADCKIINLAGAGIADKRWTVARKKEIVESRTLSLKTLYDAIEKKQLQPTHLVSASAIGYYAESEQLFTEDDLGDDSFLSSVCRQWEEAAWQFAQLNIPVAVARIGIVMGKEGGALKEFLKPLRYGMAAIPSNGQQLYSWIHIDDVCRLLYYLSTHNKEGIFNAVAPQPATVNQIFKQLIGQTKPFLLKVNVPDFVLKLLLGEMAVEILKSARVSSLKIQQDGFSFLYNEVDTCVNSLMN